MPSPSRRKRPSRTITSTGPEPCASGKTCSTAGDPAHLLLKGTSGAAGPGKNGSLKDVALTVQQPITKLPGAGVEPEHIGVPVAVEIPHPDHLPLRGTSGAAGQGKNGSLKDVALTVQQPITKLPGAGVEPEHIGVPVAVEIPHPDLLPLRGTPGAAGPGKNGSLKDVALTVQQPITKLPGAGVEP